MIEIKNPVDAISALKSQREKQGVSVYRVAKTLKSATTNLYETEKEGTDMTLSKFIRWAHALELRLLLSGKNEL